jgi:renalase
MARIAVIGAGISGVACAKELASAGHRVNLLDRGLRIGGRMAMTTLRAPVEPTGHIVDIGAAYATASDPDFQALMNSWIERGLAREWTDAFHVSTPAGIGEIKTGPMRYATTGGLRSLVEDLADSLPDNVRLSHPTDVAHITKSDSGIVVDENAFDAAVLAMPDQQARRLLDPAFAATITALRGIAWESVLSTTLVYSKRTWAEFDGLFVNESPDLTWIADDGRRRGDDAPVLVAHSTGELARQHLETPERALPRMRGAVEEILGVSAEPVWSQIKRWTHARPLVAREAPFHLDPGTKIGVCGDAWHGSPSGGPRIEAAWLSGRALGRALAELL